MSDELNYYKLDEFYQKYENIFKKFCPRTDYPSSDKCIKCLNDHNWYDPNNNYNIAAAKVYCDNP